jgi:hypothetical protein
MEWASVAMDGDSRTAMDGPIPKQSCPLEWVPQAFTSSCHKKEKINVENSDSGHRMCQV